MLKNLSGRVYVHSLFITGVIPLTGTHKNIRRKQGAVLARCKAEAIHHFREGETH